MRVEDLRRAAARYRFPVREDAESGWIRIEAPPGSGRSIVARPTSDSTGYLLVGTVEVSESHQLAFHRAEPCLRKEAVADLASYICLLDVEFELDRFEDVPRAVKVSGRWFDDQGDGGFFGAVRSVLRAKEGVIQRLRFWAHRLDRLTAQGTAQGGASADESRATPQGSG